MHTAHKVGFTYTIEHIGVDGIVKSTDSVHNLIPLLGVNYMMGAAFIGVSQYTAWYLSAFNASRTPASGDTMSTFLADCEENTDYTIVGSDRPSIAFPEIIDGSLTTIADPNVLAFTGASTVRGAFITTNITRGNNAGLLISAVLFPSPKVMAAGESLKIPVGFALIST
jgi:hypothetical protein